MAFANSNDYLTGRKPVPIPAGNEVVATRFAVSLATGDLALNDVGSIGILPAGHVPVALYIDSDDLDSNGTPTIAASVGFINSGETDLDGTAWATAITTAQAGGAAAVSLSKDVMRMAATTSDRKFGVKFTTAAATAQAGTLGLTLLYRPA